MAASTDLPQKNINTSQAQENLQNDKAMAAMLSLLNEVRSFRPTASPAFSKTETTRRTVIKIITSAREIFTRDGHDGLTLRNVADHANIAVGNLTYHFQTKTDLLEAMLRETLTDYVDAHFDEIERDRDTPIEILLSVVGFYARNAAVNYRFFYQVWGYAGSSNDAKAIVRELYRAVGRILYYLVRSANPKLDDAQIRRAIWLISSLEEGYKLLIGMEPRDDAALATAEQDIRDLTRRIVMGDKQTD